MAKSTQLDSLPPQPLSLPAKPSLPIAKDQFVATKIKSFIAGGLGACCAVTFTNPLEVIVIHVNESNTLFLGQIFSGAISFSKHL